MADPVADPVLRVDDLRVSFRARGGVAEAVTGLSYELAEGETLALVGESGSGKSVGALALTGLLPQPPARIAGSVHFRGSELVGAGTAALRAVRGPGIAMVFQDPMTALNPVLTIGRQLTEGMEAHLGLSGAAARSRAVELLARVGLPDPERRLDDHPHRFSGGMRQRVVIAMALACDPAVLVADEATTALDVTTQAQIVELVAELQRDLGTAVLWITHDLGVVAGIADRVAVMYGGRIVEQAPVDALFARPAHPYTAGLLGALPRLDGPRTAALTAIPGVPPDPSALPQGCAFWPRCPVRAVGRCEHERPPLRPVADGHLVATFAGEGAGA